MNPTPKGWPRLSSAVFYEDASAAIDFLCRAFAFTVRLRVDGEGGRVEHSELTYGEALVMVSSPKPELPGRARFRSPRLVDGANTQALCIIVDDVDAHCADARVAGAQIVHEPVTHDHGPEYWADRTYLALDLEGHAWWFMQRVRG